MSRAINPLNASTVKLLFKPKLVNPTFILGLADQYGINDIVIQMLLERTKSEKFAEFYSPYFPDFLIAEDSGLCHLPRCDLYASSSFKPNIVIVTGEVGPAIEDSQANYEVSNALLGFAKELECKRLLCFGMFQGENSEDKVYVAATTRTLSSAIARKIDAKPFTKGLIDGLLGTTLGIAKIQRIPAACIISPFTENTASKILDQISKILEI